MNNTGLYTKLEEFTLKYLFLQVSLPESQLQPQASYVFNVIKGKKFLWGQALITLINRYESEILIHHYNIHDVQVIFTGDEGMNLFKTTKVIKA